MSIKLKFSRRENKQRELYCPDAYFIKIKGIVTHILLFYFIDQFKNFLKISPEGRRDDRIVRIQTPHIEMTLSIADPPAGHLREALTFDREETQ